MRRAGEVLFALALQLQQLARLCSGAADGGAPVDCTGGLAGFHTCKPCGDVGDAVFERAGTAVNSTQPCWAGLGTDATFTAQLLQPPGGGPTAPVKFQVVVNGGPGPGGYGYHAGACLRDATVFAAAPYSQEGRQQDDQFSVSSSGVSRTNVHCGENVAATVEVRIGSQARAGAFHGLVTVTASSGSLAWAIHYTLVLEAAAPPPEAAPLAPPPADPGAGAAAHAALYAFNVKDFGAVGDGHHDDTLAIQTAMCAAGAHTMAARQGSYAESSAELFFPFGVYLISRALVPECNQGQMPPPGAGTPAHQRGEGTAIIQQTNASADILWTTGIWRWRVSGFHFVNGRNHIFLGNNNSDSTHVTIGDCYFSNATSAAVRLVGHGGLCAVPPPWKLPWPCEFYGGVEDSTGLP
jgi:hypothetical protein